MTNLGWIRCRTCSSSLSMISGGTTSRGSHNGIIANMSNVHGDHFMRRSHIRYYRYYRPWINYNQYTGTYHYNKQQQIAQFCKKAKKIIKDNAQVVTGSFAAVSSSNTGTTATNTASTTNNTNTNAPTASSPPPKNLRRKKKDNIGTTTSSSSSNSNHNHDTRILVPLSEQYQNVVVRASSSPKAPPSTPQMTCVYVHPLSQMVLLYLQSYCHDWVQARRLQYLKLQVDGTFRVRSVGVPTTTAPPLRRPTLIRNSFVNGAKPATTTTTTRHANQWFIQIWTKYEKEERKHWLCASVVTDQANTPTTTTNHHGNTPLYDMAEPKWQNRYLLQDNSVTPWQSYSQRGGTSERIQSHVQALIRAVDAALVDASPTSV